jgi:hypothetical protein
VKGELEKLAFLRGMDAHTLDLSVLPAERRRFLAGLGRRLTAQNLARRDDDRRYPILLTLVAQSAVDVLDEVLLLFDQALTGRESAAREKMTEMLAERARRGEDRQALLDAGSGRPAKQGKARPYSALGRVWWMHVGGSAVYLIRCAQPHALPSTCLFRMAVSWHLSGVELVERRD